MPFPVQIGPYPTKEIEPMRQSLIILALVVTSLVASPVGAQGGQANGTLVDGSGKTIGTIRVTETSAGVAIAASYSGIPAGQHGIHLHAVGKCDGPDFMSAGAHFNPDNKQHGAQNPQGPHAGDLGNLASTGAGMQQFTATTKLVTLGTGSTSVFDADGTALVIHANPDDEKTDPTGNSGGRIACAVLNRTAAATTLPTTGVGRSGLSMPWISLALVGIGAAAVVVGVTSVRRASRTTR